MLEFREALYLISQTEIMKRLRKIPVNEEILYLYDDPHLIKVNMPQLRK